MKYKNFGAGYSCKMSERKDIQSFLNDIRSMDALSEQEEQELAKAGSRSAENRLIETNLKLVVSIANLYAGIMPLPDIIQHGNIGLIMAARSYKPNSGRFATYAYYYIRKYILIGIEEDARLVSRPHKAQDGAFGHASLDAPIASDGETTVTGADLLKSDFTVNANLDSLAIEVARALNTLTERERSIVCKTFGIGCKESQSWEIATEYGICEERVRQILAGALEKMKSCKNLK